MARTIAYTDTGPFVPETADPFLQKCAWCRFQGQTSLRAQVKCDAPLSLFKALKIGTEGHWPRKTASGVFFWKTRQPFPGLMARCLSTRWPCISLQREIVSPFVCIIMCWH